MDTFVICEFEGCKYNIDRICVSKWIVLSKNPVVDELRMECEMAE